ncbi:MAG: hypothetical protein K8S94_01875 [Planctomycetia bacterium]|nr:hypothetical protein [Planctomycetia bacterium]
MPINPAPCGAAPPAGAERTELEVVGGFPVHPFASKFKLLEGSEFDDLVESVRVAGRVAPIEFHDGLLIDGRNRVRAVEALRQRGYDIEMSHDEWQPRGGECVEEHIYAVNVHRRHLTDDQRAVLALELLPQIRAAKAARQAATRFGGPSRDAAAGISQPPADSAHRRRSAAEKAAASSIGQLARLAKVSGHKAAQAVALGDAVAAGTVDQDEIDAVLRGDKHLRDASPKKKRRLPPAADRDVLKFVTDDDSEPESEFDRDDTDDDEVTEKSVRRRWEWFKRPYAVADHREVRRLLMKVVAEEQRDFDRHL